MGTGAREKEGGGKEEAMRVDLAAICRMWRCLGAQGQVWGGERVKEAATSDSVAMCRGTGGQGRGRGVG